MNSSECIKFTYDIARGDTYDHFISLGIIINKFYNDKREFYNDKRRSELLRKPRDYQYINPNSPVFHNI